MTPKRLNVRLVASLAVATLFFGLGVHYLHAYQVRRNASALLAQAVAVEDQGQPEQAVEDLALYLGLVPGDTDALAKYGLLLEKVATNHRARLRALSVLQQVLLREPDRAVVRRRFVDVAMKLERFADARDHLEMLLHSFPG